MTEKKQSRIENELGELTKLDRRSLTRGLIVYAILEALVLIPVILYLIFR